MVVTAYQESGRLERGPASFDTHPDYISKFARLDFEHERRGLAQLKAIPTRDLRCCTVGA